MRAYIRDRQRYFRTFSWITRLHYFVLGMASGALFMHWADLIVMR